MLLKDPRLDCTFHYGLGAALWSAAVHAQNSKNWAPIRALSLSELSASVATSHDSPAHVAAVWLGIQSAGEVNDVIMMMVSLHHSATGCIASSFGL